MKRNELYESRRQKVSSDIRGYVRFSFDIVDRIRAILEQKGMSQHDLAILLDKTDAEISKWMRGTHNFTISTVKSIEDVFGEKIICIYGADDKRVQQNGYHMENETRAFMVAEDPAPYNAK